MADLSNGGDRGEAALLARWRAGDRDAGGELLRRHIPMLHGFFRKRTSRNVEELVQRTLVVCLDAIGHFEGRSSFKVFLLGIARNQFLKNLPTAGRTEEEPTTLTTFPEDSPSQLLASKQELQVLFDALRSLSSPFRDVLQMFYWEGMSIEEIAVALDISPGTVKSRLGRGREMLRAQVGDGHKPHAALVRRLVDEPPSNFGNLSGATPDSRNEELPSKSRS